MHTTDLRWAGLEKYQPADIDANDVIWRFLGKHRR